MEAPAHTPAATDTRHLRPWRPADRDGVIALIDGCYREYGDRICLEQYDGDLLDVPANYDAKGGAFIVLAAADGTIHGTHAVQPIDRAAGLTTFRRLYLDPSLRGSGWGERLMQWALAWSWIEGFQRVEFWSDARFTRAHAFFRRLGFTDTGELRTCTDHWEPYQERHFTLDLPA